MKSYVYVIGLLALVVISSNAAAQKTKNKTIKEQKPSQLPLQTVQSKEITAEFPCNANATVFLENTLRRINIRTTTENKVKLVTTVFYRGEPGFTDADWLQTLELNMKGTAENVVVRTGNLKQRDGKAEILSSSSNRNADTSTAKGIATIDKEGKWINRKSNITRNIILYIPAGARLNIESRYADITLENNVGEIKVRVTNGGVTLMNAEKLVVNGSYGRIYAENIEAANVEMTNGKLTAKKITTLDINSRNCSVELNEVKKIKMISNIDQYEIEQVNEVDGEKNYGGFWITSLASRLELTGINADIKIRSVKAGVSLIKIEDQYADLRLPVAGLTNYVVHFEGTGSNIYAPFEKTAITDSSFRATVGNINEKPATFRIKCINCTVDFK